MTPRQRWLAVLAGERPDRVPCDYWATAEVTCRLMRELGCATERDLWARLGVDKCIHLAPAHPAAREEFWHIQSLFSIWHVETKSVAYGDGLGTYEEDAFHPLAKAATVSDIERFPWPDPALFDVAGLRPACEKWKDHPIIGASSEPFYLYCRLRGMERAMEDLVCNRSIADAILEHILEFDLTLIRRVLEALPGQVDLVYVAEDLGTQESLLMSPRTFRRFLKPRMAKVIDMVHGFGVKVFHHDDGSIRELIPDLLEIGIDILNPVQWRCRNMQRETLARDFGASLVFHGGMDNQFTLPFGSPADVRRQVRENIEILGRAKGYIVAPCHNLQPNTPTANILALYDAVREFG